MGQFEVEIGDLRRLGGKLKDAGTDFQNSVLPNLSDAQATVQWPILMMGYQGTAMEAHRLAVDVTERLASGIETTGQTLVEVADNYERLA